MSRSNVRSLKRSLAAVSHGLASAEDSLRARLSALQLLDRSIRFGHHRLAILRIATAVEVGATPSADHWAYCRRVAAISRDESLQTLFIDAAKAAYPAPSAASPSPGH